MFRAIGSGILLNIGIAASRGRFFRTTFTQQSHRYRFLLLSCLSSSFLALFPRINRATGWSALSYLQPLSSATQIALLLGVLLVIGGILYFLLAQKPQRHTLLVGIIFMGCIGSILAYQVRGASGIRGTRLLVALIEERTKTITSRALFDRFAYISSDLIFFGLISALGFALVENVVYLFQLSDLSVGGGIVFTLKRILTSRVMHLTYTGLIMVGINFLTSLPKKRIIGISCCGGGILLHTIFNSLLGTEQHFFFLVLLLISGYLFISRLIYQSERVYI